MKTWRYIVDGSQTASFNMAADAYLLEYAASPDSIPVLRLYDWDIPSITIGYHQTFERAVRIDRLGTTPVVRRVTGGRALLHGVNDITYSVSADFLRFPELGETMAERYRAISDGIVAFYHAIGWEAHMSRRDAPVSLSGNRHIQKGCFAAVSQYEISIGRAKMAAGSQRYTKQEFIQHGTIMIGPPHQHPAILNPADGADSDTISMTREIYGKRYDLLSSSVARRFDARLEAKPFSPSELRRIAEIETGFENLNKG
ncbi:MAG: hypothetical protein R3F48_05735 [Candidatus Zixiibacteriota bacterium]